MPHPRTGVDETMAPITPIYIPPKYLHALEQAREEGRESILARVRALRDEIQSWAELVATRPEITVKTPFDALTRVLIEFDKLEAHVADAPVTRETT